ncbi:peptidoglycan recognition protein family protein [Clostridium algidicarnis]|uniref:peptidoglycan recognition protein family protein n=1 Tax=Clostridium algidicarnis TaxID=37659 RepID=UPI003FD8304A
MNIIDINLRFNGLRQNNNSPKSIVVHHIEANNWTVERLNSLHRDEFGWAGIGYHFYVRKDGSVYRGRPESTQGAHVAEFNHNSLGVAFEGDYHKVDKEMPQAQFNAWVELKSYLFNKYGAMNIYGHKEVGSSNCPGQYFPLDKIKNGAIETKENFSAPSSTPAPLSFSYPNNAKVIRDFLYVRDSIGNILPGRRVDIGDNITVLDVGYTKQLMLVEYPTPSGVKRGYVTNATNCIEYYYKDEYANGSTKETVYDENGLYLGSLDPYEKATPLYRKGGRLHVVYGTDKGKNTKSGYVIYNGGFNKF